MMRITLKKTIDIQLTELNKGHNTNKHYLKFGKEALLPPGILLPTGMTIDRVFIRVTISPTDQSNGGG